MKALVHIGLPKAGSSSIQEFLKLNREALAGRGVRSAPFQPKFGSQFELGIAALDALGLPPERGMARLVTEVHTPDEARAYARRFTAFLDAGLNHWSEPLYIASSEHLAVWLNRPERVEALDRFLSARFAEVRYLVYLRPQADLVLSGYSERIRRGGSITLEAHLAEGRQAHDHLALVERWENAVGAGRLDVRLLTPATLTDGDLLTDFCAAMGTGVAGLARPPQMHGALQRGDIRFRQWLNRHLRMRRAGGGSNPLYMTALYAGRLLGLRGGAPLVLSPEQRARIEAQYATSNEALRARRFPDRPTLF
jgi:hypothetical protein